MNVKDTVSNFESSQNSILETLSNLRKLVTDESGLWSAFENVDDTFFMNDRSMNFFADFLQLVDNKELLATYDLIDVKHIYEILVKHYPQNMQYHEDLIAFVYNVMDEEEEELELAKNAEKLLIDRENSLKKLITRVKTRS